MIHVYSRNEVQSGRFVYFKKKNLEALYYTYRSSKKKMYRKFSTMRGSFPDAFEKIINVDEYESKKDKAIDLIGVKIEKIKVAKRELHYVKYMNKLVNSHIPREDILKALNIDKKLYSKWKNMEIPLEIEEFRPPTSSNIINVWESKDEDKNKDVAVPINV
jgi:hypothetical protein